MHPPPPSDREAAAVWDQLSQTVFAGRGLRVDADSLEAIRAVKVHTRESVLATFPYDEREVVVPAADGSVALSVFSPRGVVQDAPGVYWIHGGGMVAGDRFSVAEALNAVADAGAVVASVEYRLAPEHPSPAPGDDCYAGLLWFAEHAAEFGVDPGLLFLGGASAGGGLAAATALRARDNDGPRLAGVLIYCPMLDDRMTTVSSGQFGEDMVWSRNSNEFGWRSLLGDRAGGDEVTIYEAPGRATDLSGLPPVFVDVGSTDIFRDEDVAFASGVWAGGGEAELHVWPGGYHGFEMLAPATELAIDALAARRRWFMRTLATARVRARA